jgi:hypothetical protein
VLSKCANPECSEQFRHLHKGKLFHLTPTPEVQALDSDFCDALYERFWLCEQCCKRMRVIWDGTQARIVSLLATERAHREDQSDLVQPSRRRATSAGRHRR